MSTALVPSPSATPVRRLGWPEFAVATVGWLVLGNLAALALLSAVPRVGIAALVGVQAVVSLAVVGLALALRVRSLAPLRLDHPGRRWLLVGLAAGVGMKLVTVAVVLGWQALTGDTSNPQQFLVDGVTAGGWSLVGMLVAGGVLVPVTEELLFRGVVRGALRRYGPVVAALGSSAVFGLFHVAPLVILVAFLLGVVNCALVERSGSIWPAVITHVTMNTTALVAAALLL